MSCHYLGYKEKSQRKESWDKSIGCRKNILLFALWKKAYEIWEDKNNILYSSKSFRDFFSGFYTAEGKHARILQSTYLSGPASQVLLEIKGKQTHYPTSCQINRLLINRISSESPRSANNTTPPTLGYKKIVIPFFLRQDSKKLEKFLGERNGESVTDDLFTGASPSALTHGPLLLCRSAPLGIEPSGQGGSDQHQMIFGTKPQVCGPQRPSFGQTRGNTSRPQLCFSSRSRKAAKPDKVMPWLTSGPDAMTNDPPCPSVDQSAETMTLNTHLNKSAY